MLGTIRRFEGPDLDLDATLRAPLGQERGSHEPEVGMNPAAAASWEERERAVL
jgi:hypothetical protein